MFVGRGQASSVVPEPQIRTVLRMGDPETLLLYDVTADGGIYSSHH